MTQVAEARRALTSEYFSDSLRFDSRGKLASIAVLQTIGLRKSGLHAFPGVFGDNCGGNLRRGRGRCDVCATPVRDFRRGSTETGAESLIKP